MRPYTIIGVYEDAFQYGTEGYSYVEHVMAEDISSAIEVAMEVDPARGELDSIVVAVFPGHHSDLLFESLPCGLPDHKAEHEYLGGSV